MSDQEYYYVFKDEDGCYYYFNHSTQETSYDKPSTGVFLDPNTNEIFDFGDSPTPKSEPPPANKEPEPVVQEEVEPEQDNDDDDNFVIPPDADVYYIYVVENGPPYYYCHKTGETTYDQPTDGLILDPNTNKPYRSPEEKSKPKPKKKVHLEPEPVKQPEPEPVKQPEPEPVKQPEPEPVQQNEPKQEAENESKHKHERKSTSKHKHHRGKSDVTHKVIGLIEEEPPQEEEKYDESKIYYIYFSPDNSPYFYHHQSGNTTYDRPADGIILDPSTNKRYKFPGEENTTTSEKHVKIDNSLSHPSKRKAHHKPSNSVSLQESAELTKIARETYNPPTRDRRNTLPPRKSFFPDANQLSLPTDLKNDIHKFQVANFAHKFFKEHRKRRFFSNKRISSQELSSYQEEPIHASLLQSLPKSSQKDAIECFKLILSYTGANGSPKALSANTLIGLVSKNSILIDEVFFQLAKQTHNNPKPQVLLKTWQLFLVIATIFPASRDSEIWLKSHIAGEFENKDQKISDLAHFTYIRFTSRFVIGKPLENTGPTFISKTLKDPYESNHTFGASIQEQLWNQKRKYPKCYIPIILYKIIDMLNVKNCQNHEGIFRLPGNAKLVEKYQGLVNDGKEIPQDAAINDLASLLKSWFGLLPDKIIPEELSGEFVSVIEDKNYVEFYEKLPQANALALKYLIGFLQDLDQYKESTKMPAKNIAICFAPNIVDPVINGKNINNGTIEFLVELIDKLNTEDTYPLPPHFLEEA